MNSKYFCWLLLIPYIIQSQSITIQGEIMDLNSLPLSFANIIADPMGDASLSFAISDENGHYSMKLEKGQAYRITVSYLGYIPQTIEITAGKHLTKKFILQEGSEQLDEVKINYTPPITVKKDTITYRTDAFTTGKERKLRDLLKKLPAVEVDRAGNVTVQGKKVTRVLVEDKEFFTGDSKLAVNNIPADTVEEIQVLDNYNQVGFLKGLEDSDDMAMNIKLKEDKKRFMFGDIESGAGVKDRYLSHPSLYYYSPKTSINTIGDFNNTGNKSFTLRDYLNFEGGQNKLINDPKGYFSLLNDDFSQFLGQNDFTSSQNQFGALSLSESISNKTDFSSYGIWSDMRNKTKVETLNDYLASNNLIENRTNSGQQNSRIGIGKLAITIKPDNDTNLSFETYLKASNNYSQNNIFTAVNNNTIGTKLDAENVSVKEDIQWHKQFNRKQTSSAVFNYHFQRTIPNTSWLTDQTILKGLIPLLGQNSFNIFKRKKTKSNNIDLTLKHYWILDRFNHIYFTSGLQMAFDDYSTNEFQLLEDGTTNDFSSSNFGNSVSLNFTNNFFGIHYKTQRGKFILKPGLFYHYYDWRISQFGNRVTKSKVLLLPEFHMEVEPKNSEKLIFDYNLKLRFPDISQLANGFTLINFNNIYRGNANLENELYHHFRFRYHYFSIFKDLSYNINASYRVKEENFKNNISIQGIDFISSPVLSSFEDKVWSFSVAASKGVGNYKFSIHGNVTLAAYEKPINTEIIANTSNNSSFGGGVKTRFKNFPNFELSYTKAISFYHANTKSEFQNDVFSAFFEYEFFNDFVLKSDYQFENYKNKTFDITSTFDIANLTLFYQKEQSPWGFEISASNIFDVRFKQRNSFSSILVSDEKTFILPRIMMFKLSYKL